MENNLPKRVNGYLQQVDILKNRFRKCKTLKDIGNLKVSIDTTTLGVQQYCVNQSDIHILKLLYTVISDIAELRENVLKLEKLMKENNRLKRIIRHINVDFGISEQYYLNLDELYLYREELS